MKLLTLTMAITILFLAIKPGIDLISFQSKTESSCCIGTCESNSEEPADDQQKNRDCSGKACNPFQVCGSCVIYCNDMQVLIPELDSAPITKVAYWFIPISIKNQASDFWQPPKLV